MPSGGNDGSFCFNHFEVDVKTTIQYEKLYIYIYVYRHLHDRNARDNGVYV